jgi:hypothetical protein
VSIRDLLLNIEVVLRDLSEKRLYSRVSMWFQELVKVKDLLEM